MMKKSYVAIAIILLLLGFISREMPAGVFPNDSEIGKSYLVLAHTFDTRIICRAYTDEKVVALTFDDGPDPRFTPPILDILNRYQIKATFFVVGEDASLEPQLVQREMREGHEVENHTYTHPDLLKEKEAELSANEEILWCQEAITRLTGREPVYFRPPRRLYNLDLLKLADIYGYKVVLWTVCFENSQARTPEKMAKRVLSKCGPGAILLAHDGRLDRSSTVKALPLVIEKLQQQGYRFVTLQELLNHYDIVQDLDKSGNS